MSLLVIALLLIFIHNYRQGSEKNALWWLAFVFTIIILFYAYNTI